VVACLRQCIYFVNFCFIKIFCEKLLFFQKALLFLKKHSIDKRFVTEKKSLKKYFKKRIHDEICFSLTEPNSANKVLPIEVRE